MSLSSYHNHSTWSDGKATVADMVAHARGLGMDEVGISDHLVLRPRGDVPKWSMAPDRVADYVTSVREAAARAAAAGGPAVRVGVEVDWYPGHADRLRAALAPHGFDYVIGSVHEVGPFVVDASGARWDALDAETQNAMHRGYWIAMRSLAESGVFDVAAHLDLTKKFGHRPGVDLDDEIDAALDAIAAAGLVVELNTAGWHKPCEDAYPSLDLLRRVRARDVAVTLSADAHQPEHLLRDFDRGVERLRAAGFEEVVRFPGQRRRATEPLHRALVAGCAPLGES